LQVLDRRTCPRRTREHASRYAAPRRECWRSRPCVRVTAFSAHPLETTGTGFRGPNRQCATASARFLPVPCGDLKSRFEQWSHCRRPVPKLVVFVPPFFIDLIFSRFQGVDAPVKT